MSIGQKPTGTSKPEICERYTAAPIKRVKYVDVSGSLYHCAQPICEGDFVVGRNRIEPYSLSPSNAGVGGCEIQVLCDHAKAHGFTHIELVTDWVDYPAALELRAAQSGLDLQVTAWDFTPQNVRNALCS